MSWCLYTEKAAVGVGSGGDHVVLTIQTAHETIMLRLQPHEADKMAEELERAAEGSLAEAASYAQDSLFGDLGRPS